MKAFHIKVNGKLLDTRLGHKIDLNAFSKHLETKNYRVINLWQEKRHAVGVIEKDNIKYFVKLATSEGMTYTTLNEFKWNDGINNNNSNFLFPQNYDSGYFNKLYYLVVDYQDGEKLAERPNPGYEHPEFGSYLNDVVDISEFIQSSKIQDLNLDGDIEYKDYQARFISRTRGWFDEVSVEVRSRYKLNELLEIVEKDARKLEGKLRHGDFTPWHIFITKKNKLFLFDGERALSKDVENYDICFFIQRIYSVIENKELGLDLLNKLRERNYNFGKLKPVLASRAIGGFLDKSLHDKPDYRVDLEFKNLVLNL